MKKTISIILAMTFVLTFFSCFVVNAEIETKTVNFIKNCGFENLDGTTGLPSDWSLFGGGEGETPFSVVNDKPAGGGNNALKMSSETGGLFLTQSVYDFIPGETYSATAFTKAIRYNSYSVICKIEFYDSAVAGSGSIVGTPVQHYFYTEPAGTKDVWEKHDFTFEVPAGTRRANVAFRMTKSGEVIWDNIYIVGKRIIPDLPHGTEFLKNRNLASIDEATGVPTGWSISGGEIGAGKPFEISSDIPAGSAGHSIKMTKGTTNLFFSPNPSNISGVIPGETYTLSAWTKNHTHVGWGVMATVNFFPQDALGGMLSSVNLDFVRDTVGAGAVWEYHEVSFTLPEGTNMITVSFRVSSTSSVSWHNFSLKGDRTPANKNAASTEDVMVNGSFETKGGGVPTGWNIDGTVVDSFVTGSAYDGNTSLLLAGAGEYITSDPLPLTKGERYTVNAYIKSSVADAARITVMQVGADAQTSKTFGSTGGNWQKVSHSFVVDQGATGVKIRLGSVAEDVGLEFDKVSVYLSNDVAVNGSFEELSGGVPAHWTIQGANWETALKTDGTIDGSNYINLPVNGNYVQSEITGVTNSKTYELKVNYKSSTAGAAQVGIETPGYTNKASGDWIFNRYVNYSLNFAASGGAWKVIKFNITPADGASVIKVKLAAAVDDPSVCFDNLTIKPTTNLYSNGDFEGAEIVSAQAPGITDALALGWAPSSGATAANLSYITDAAGACSGEKFARVGGGTTEPFVGQYVPVEPGETYKLSVRVKSIDAKVPASFWQSNTYSGLSFGQGTRIAMNPVSTSNVWCWHTRYIVGPTVMPVTGEAWEHRDIQVFFRMAASGYISKTYDIDDVIFEKVDTAMTFYNDAGEEISTLTPGGRVRVNYIQTTEITAKPTSLILALYAVEDGKEKLIKTVMKTGTATADNALPLTAALTVLNDGRQFRVKAFNWNGLGTIEPYNQRIVLE